MLLLKVLTGSRQHGFFTETSDFDVYEIYSSIEDFNSHAGRPEKQTIKDDMDVVQMTLSRFVERASFGSHQVLDVMFAKETEVDVLTALRHGFNVSPYAYEKFREVIIDLALLDEPKKHRHALRIAYNLKELVETGRYTPELSNDVKQIILNVIAEGKTAVKEHIQAICPIQIFA